MRTSEIRRRLEICRLRDPPPLVETGRVRQARSKQGCRSQGLHSFNAGVSVYLSSLEVSPLTKQLAPVSSSSEVFSEISSYKREIPITDDRLHLLLAIMKPWRARRRRKRRHRQGRRKYWKPPRIPVRRFNLCLLAHTCQFCWWHVANLGVNSWCMCWQLLGN